MSTTRPDDENTGRAPASPTDAADLNAQLDAIANWGGEFTGEPWLLAMRALEPLAEVVLVAATTRATYERSAAPRPTGVSLAMMETGDGPVVIVHLTLYDHPANPLTLELFVNPMSVDGGAILDGLACQRTLQVLFFDRQTAEDLGRRVLPVAADFRAGTRAILDRVGGDDDTTTSQRWERAVAAVRAHLG